MNARTFTAALLLAAPAWSAVALVAWLVWAVVR